ncbi:hypothetical protein G6F32_014822 [Rhizopus arrhizus]|nr:hypothetical protein G6F32_014822 [Rhizopus arrhizus]
MLAKNLTFLANAEAAGIVLGARVPIILTSRGAARHDLVHGDRLAALQARHQAQVGAGVQADVVCILPIDAFKALGDDQAHAGRLFGHGAVFTRRALAVALAGHHNIDAGPFDRIDADGARRSRRKAGVGIAPQLLVEMR